MRIQCRNSLLLFSVFLSPTVSMAAICQESFISMRVKGDVINSLSTFHMMRCSFDVWRYCCSTAIRPKIIIIFKCRRANSCQVSLFLFKAVVLICQKLLFLIANYMTFKILLWGVLNICIVIFDGTWRIVHLLLWYRYVILCWSLHHKVVRCPVSNNFLEGIHIYFLSLFLFLAHICVWGGVLLYVIWFFYLIRTFGGNIAWNWSLDRRWLILGSTNARYFWHTWHSEYSRSLF